MPATRLPFRALDGHLQRRPVSVSKVHIVVVRFTDIRLVTIRLLLGAFSLPRASFSSSTAGLSANGTLNLGLLHTN